MYFNDISPGLSESQLRFRLIHFWEAKNIAKGGTLIGVGMGLPNSTASVRNFIKASKIDKFRSLRGSKMFTCNDQRIIALELDTGASRLQSLEQLMGHFTAYKTVKSSQSIFELVQAAVVVEDMIKTECLKNELWYCSSLLAAVKMLYGLTVHLFTLDAAIIYYNKTITQSDMDETKPIGLPGQKSQPVSDPQERSSRGKCGKHSRKASGRVQKRRLLYQSRFNVCLCVAV
ncbi:hypothetical protein IGI04_026590 [Brassica rapa subsp. trilocularis]|uniref:Uncharacterized protein n=1 Tax=Brassica rapa subsp. trilocularis TaxID=1813537 RepID=A0ABQ7L0A2_BRACM|nr:hypothetical protein IGI04_026590 [Brassica rapa subsp. trilocularis]